jgi:hypothetical protein
MKQFETIQKTTPTGQIVAIPKAVITGKNDGPVLAIVAAVHGSEYCGIEAAIRLYRDLNDEEMSGTLRMALAANLPAFHGRTMYRCPIDNENVGRSFPGSPGGTYSQLAGHMIWQEIVGDADYVLDLHGGDLIEVLTQYVGYYVSGDAELDRKAREAVLVLGSENVEERPLPQEEKNMSLHQAAASARKVGILIEAGSQGRRDEGDVLFHYNGILSLMRHLGMLEGKSLKPESNIRFLDDFVGVTAGAEGIFYSLVEANVVVEKDQPIGEIRSFTSDLIEAVTSPVRGVVLGVITPASTHEGAMLFGIGRLGS